jgi:hypothetical protein
MQGMKHGGGGSRACRRPAPRNFFSGRGGSSVFSAGYCLCTVRARAAKSVYRRATAGHPGAVQEYTVCMLRPEPSVTPGPTAIAGTYPSSRPPIFAGASASPLASSAPGPAGAGPRSLGPPSSKDAACRTDPLVRSPRSVASAAAASVATAAETPARESPPARPTARRDPLGGCGGCGSCCASAGSGLQRPVVPATSPPPPAPPPLPPANHPLRARKSGSPTPPAAAA